MIYSITESFNKNLNNMNRQVNNTARNTIDALKKVSDYNRQKERNLNNVKANQKEAEDEIDELFRQLGGVRESYGIFSEIEFLNENRAHKHMKEIKHSAGYKGMKELLKRASKSKDPKDKVEAALKCISVLDDLIEAAKDIPKNDFGDSFINAVRWIPLMIITTLLGVPQAVVDTSQTKDEFINYLLRLKVKCIKIYEKNKALI